MKPIARSIGLISGSFASVFLLAYIFAGMGFSGTFSVLLPFLPLVFAGVCAPRVLVGVFTDHRHPRLLAMITFMAGWTVGALLVPGVVAIFGPTGAGQGEGLIAAAIWLIGMILSPGMALGTVTDVPRKQRAGCCSE